MYLYDGRSDLGWKFSEASSLELWPMGHVTTDAWWIARISDYCSAQQNEWQEMSSAEQ